MTECPAMTTSALDDIEYVFEESGTPGLLLRAETDDGWVWAVIAAQHTRPFAAHGRARWPRELAEKFCADLGASGVDWTAPWEQIEEDTRAHAAGVAAGWAAMPNLAMPAPGGFCEVHFSWTCGKAWGGCQVFGEPALNTEGPMG